MTPSGVEHELPLNSDHDRGHHHGDQEHGLIQFQRQNSDPAATPQPIEEHRRSHRGAKKSMVVFSALQNLGSVSIAR
jgi:hypothetical protein